MRPDICASYLTWESKKALALGIVPGSEPSVCKPLPWGSRENDQKCQEFRDHLSFTTSFQGLFNQTHMLVWMGSGQREGKGGEFPFEGIPQTVGTTPKPNVLK
eukprot:1602889-Rhodomonas_salina.1